MLAIFVVGLESWTRSVSDVTKLCSMRQGLCVRIRYTFWIQTALPGRLEGDVYGFFGGWLFSSSDEIANSGLFL